jgi:hypothetical protein
MDEPDCFIKIVFPIKALTTRFSFERAGKPCCAGATAGAKLCTGARRRGGFGTGSAVRRARFQAGTVDFTAVPDHPGRFAHPAKMHIEALGLRRPLAAAAHRRE